MNTRLILGIVATAAIITGAAVAIRKRRSSHKTSVTCKSKLLKLEYIVFDFYAF